jgi:hypothetical protein
MGVPPDVAPAPAPCCLLLEDGSEEDCEGDDAEKWASLIASFGFAEEEGAEDGEGTGQSHTNRTCSQPSPSFPSPSWSLSLPVRRLENDSNGGRTKNVITDSRTCPAGDDFDEPSDAALGSHFQAVFRSKAPCITRRPGRGWMACSRLGREGGPGVFASTDAPAQGAVGGGHPSRSAHPIHFA